MSELVFGASQADPESFDLADPAFALGLGDAGNEVVTDLLQPAALSRVRPEERATNTSVFVDADGAVGAGAGADGEFAAFEVAEEVLPSSGARPLTGRPVAAAA